jgi:hypothetical protein
MEIVCWYCHRLGRFWETNCSKDAITVLLKEVTMPDERRTDKGFVELGVPMRSEQKSEVKSLVYVV